jgi:DNA (cytosine-5)-methyltransferase 1
MSSPTFVDLFSGAGGLSLGLAAGGWTCLAAIDNWSDAAQTYGQNFEDHPIIEADISDFSARQLARVVEAPPDWVVGGPPCQGFSTVGKRERTDPRNLMVGHFHRLVKELAPEGFVIENVLGLKDMRFQGAIRELFEELGYEVSFHVLRAADHGVPQLRRRVVFVGHRDRGRFVGPRPSHSEQEYVTVWDAIGDLPPVGPGETATSYDRPPTTDYQREMRVRSNSLQGHTVSNHPPHLVKAISFIPDGGNRRAIPSKYQPNSGYHNSYSRLSSREPAVAVTSNMGKPSATRCIHPFQHRGLTAREGARLQSFADKFHFAGGVVSQRLQIANAVPPRLAESIGRAILDDSRWTTAEAVEAPEQLPLRLAA